MTYIILYNVVRLSKVGTRITLVAIMYNSSEINLVMFSNRNICANFSIANVSISAYHNLLKYS